MPIRWFERFKKQKPSDLNAIKNDALLQAIDALARSDTATNRAKFYNVLLKSWLIIPTPELPGELKTGTGRFTSTADTNIQVTGFTDNQKLRVTPAFTDNEALRNWDPNTPSVGLTAPSFFQMIKDLEIDAVVINPHDPIRKMLRPGGRLNRFEFVALAQGLIPGQPGSSGVMPMTFAKGQKVYIGLPASPPSDQVLHALAERARTIDEIQQVYLFLTAIGGGDPQITFGIDVKQATENSRTSQIINALASSIHPLLKTREHWDFMVVQGELAGPIRQQGKRLLP